MSADDEGRTEDPTDKRLEKAREDGNFTQSQEVKTAAALTGALVMIAMLVPGMLRDLTKIMVVFLEPHAIATDPYALRWMLLGVAGKVALVMALPLGTLFAFGFLSSYFQAGLHFNSKAIGLDIGKLSPAKGLKRIISVNSMVEAGKGLVKMGLVGIGLTGVAWPHAKELTQLPGMELPQLLSYLHHLVVVLVEAVVIMVIGIAVPDWMWQRHRFMETVMMSKQEVKDEHKDAEGNPEVKGKLRALRMQRARQRMLQAVPKADVIVTNPTHYACALKYDMETMNAPILVAKGVDFLAAKIRELADKHEIPIVENPPLARALYATVEIDREVPPEHYKAVAEVIGYVMRLKKHIKG